jgi:hypothetical protein
VLSGAFQASPGATVYDSLRLLVAVYGMTTRLSNLRKSVKRTDFVPILDWFWFSRLAPRFSLAPFTGEFSKIGKEKVNFW